MLPAAPEGQRAMWCRQRSWRQRGLCVVGGSERVGVGVGGGGAWRSSKSADVACRSSVFLQKDRAEAKPSLYGRCPQKIA